MRTACNRAGKILQRPGVGSLLILLAGAVIPPPAPGGGSAHLLGIPTLCPLRAATGVPCPGCGITRALCLCCHGRFAEAVTLYHPLVPLVFAGLIAAAGYGLLYKKPLPERWLTPLAYGTVALMIAVWVARLLHVLPSPPP
ncbi:MAG: DUF2752 domain-containing protein [Akkermansiaceae bacterium]|nr:DUF2752 domain-containing protein [Armatimonadota bacterium]